MIHRLIPIAASASLSAATLAAALVAVPAAAPVALAHVGHGDEFQQQGEARQVRRNRESDALMGVATAMPEAGPDGLTVPGTAVVDADGQPLLFVQTETTYDPVYVETGGGQGDRVVVTTGIDPTDDVVISGALSLYAESLKTEQAEPAAGAESAEESGGKQAQPAAGRSLPAPALIAGAVVVLAAGAFALSRGGRRDA
ncbi:MAG: efflux RND transporter periplasmic adaptor subunit [Cyanobium sp. PLM2.Bin73]|nr:MAG: efflux RND transporter periplasmic adaptor subunit [Cyanobium sp. PLM2.Bin73]